MDSVHEADEPLDIGVCPEHNRVYECYCTQCFCMICPTCLMFDKHKGHQVCRIEEGAKFLRKSINTSAKDGFLKFDRTENVLLDIRHVRLSLEQNQQKILQQVENSFDELITVLKTRKNKFSTEIKEHFNIEMQKIEDTEAEWVRRQELSQKILQLQTSNDDIKLIEEAKQIVEGLKDLERPLDYKEIRLIESVHADSQFGKTQIGFADLKEILRNFMRQGDSIINKLKC